MTAGVQEVTMFSLQRAISAAIAATIALPAASAVPAKAAFTLEQVLSAPFPTDLTAAPDGVAVAWVFNDRGARNVWVAQPPDYKGKRLTEYLEDDGQEISGLDRKSV